MSTFPRMMQQFTESAFAECEKTRYARISAIQTAADANEYVAQCRKTLRSIYALPTDIDRAVPGVQVTGSIDHELYRIERLVFESRSGFLVSANLYIPAERTGVAPPFPCVLGACGHSDLGKAEPKYQSFCAGLASKGFLTLIYDPIGQGERFQYPDRQPPIAGCVAEHVVIGAKLSLLGDYFGSWRAWDAIRALDVLLDRPDADATRVGMTGNSGGGTMTTIVAALEDRLTMIAPSCFITTYRRNLENELPADTEQIPPGILAAGYELFDHLSASAPRPTLIVSKADDFFDLRGAKLAYEELSCLYGFLDSKSDVEAYVGAGGHGFDLELREAMYRFFLAHSGLDADFREPKDIVIHDEADLRATSDGNVFSLGSRSVLDFITEELDIAEANRIDRKRNSPAEFTEEMPKHLSATLGLDRYIAIGKPQLRILRRRRNRSRMLLETGSNVATILSFSTGNATAPESSTLFTIPGSDRGVIVVSGTEAVEAEESTPFIEHARSVSTFGGAPVYLVSPRGLGESLPDTCGGEVPTALYDADFFYTSYGLMMNMPVVGGRVHDILSVASLLEAHGYSRLTMAGRGFGALLALYAAPFITIVDELIIDKPVPDLASIVRSDYLECPISFLPEKALLWYDLGDIIQFLEDRGTTVRIV